ncbi:MAG: hypothetical protein M1835_000168 [Candelina submexicana]|nr:MAG: hypothetical protein M1835_000168 [Candelina submexicana]
MAPPDDRAMQDFQHTFQRAREVRRDMQSDQQRSQALYQTTLQTPRVYHNSPMSPAVSAGREYRRRSELEEQIQGGPWWNILGWGLEEQDAGGTAEADQLSGLIDALYAHAEAGVLEYGDPQLFGSLVEDEFDDDARVIDDFSSGPLDAANAMTWQTATAIIPRETPWLLWTLSLARHQRTSLATGDNQDPTNMSPSVRRHIESAAPPTDDAGGDLSELEEGEIDESNGLRPPFSGVSSDDGLEDCFASPAWDLDVDPETGRMV